jgi:hypothetical protein
MDEGCFAVFLRGSSLLECVLFLKGPTILAGLVPALYAAKQL